MREPDGELDWKARLPPSVGRRCPAMARPAAVTPGQIRTTVLTMLAEAGDANADAACPPPSVTRERFRRAVSVRRLRVRLGAGDPAVLSRH
ncbi:hypothetical protein PSAB6_640030 [Paraburkholderia sabiae]|nr:hypothetical protein PSAB6_640030 [Paraburkholderia sabiae]